MNGPIGIQRNALRPGGAHSTRDPLVSGTWYTPSTTRPTRVTFQFSATGIDSGALAQFQIEVRDIDDNTLSGYPLTHSLSRGGLVSGSETIAGVIAVQVSAGYDYRVLNNSIGTTSENMRAIEDQL